VVNPARGFVDAIALSPDASHVATGERNGSIRVWAHANGAEPISLGEYRQAIVDLAFSPNAGMLASLGRHPEGALRLWQPDGRGGANLWAEVVREVLTAFDLAATGAKLLTAGHEGEVTVWDKVTQ
jgi:WD40 repeat protein